MPCGPRFPRGRNFCEFSHRRRGEPDSIVVSPLDTARD